MANNILSFFNQYLPRFRTGTGTARSHLPRGNTEWRQTHYTRPSQTGGLSGGIQDYASGLVPKYQAMAQQAAPPVSTGMEDAWSYGGVGGGGAGYSMPDLTDEANAIVAAAVAKQKAANQAAREAALSEYQRMKQEYDLASQASQGAISDTAKDDRARLNNMMASRGIGAGEAAAMNFGRFDESTQGRLAEAMAYYNAQNAAALDASNDRVSAMNEQDRLLDEGSPAEAFKVLQELQNSELARAQAMYSMNAGSGGGGGGGGVAGGAFENASQMWSSIGTDAVSLLDSGVTGQQALSRLNAAYAPLMGVNIEQAAQNGDQGAQRILDLLKIGSGSAARYVPKPPATGGYTNLRSGQYTPYTGESGNTSPSNFSAFWNQYWPEYKSQYTTPYASGMAPVNSVDDFIVRYLNPAAYAYRSFDKVFGPGQRQY